MLLNFQVRVKDDPTVQEAEQELFIYAARAWGDWDGAGQPPTTNCTNASVFLNGANTAIPDGWCNLSFQDDGVDTNDAQNGDLKDDFDTSAGEQFGTLGVLSAHADVVYIVEPALAISKINTCLLYTSPSPRDQRGSRMPSSA